MAVSEIAGYPVHLVNGVVVPFWVEQELVDKMKVMQHYPDDVWIVAYPKSGSVWTSQIVRLIHNRGVPDNTVLADAIPFAESLFGSGNVPVDQVPRPRAIRSHFPYDQFPCGLPHSLPSKFIYVMRNPKDLAVSFYHFCRLGLIKDLEWDVTMQHFTSGNLPYGDNLDHILSWWAHRDSENILFLKYEDMKKDLPQAVSKIASFLEVDLSPDVVKKIADLTTFDRMKADSTANMSWMKEFNDEEGKPAFCRKGEVGDWKNYFSAEQSAEFDRKSREKLKDTNIEFDYE